MNRELLKLKSLFRFRHRNAFPNSKHRIVWAFTHDGVDYYKFDTAHGDLPYKRGLEAIIAYREFQMMCSFDFLKKHVAKVNSILDAPKFNMQSAMTLKKLNTHLGERLTMPFDPGLAMSLCAIVFFDRSEDPYSYDAKYAVEKIAKWRAGTGVRDFFSHQPVTELIPFLQSYEGDIQIFSETVEAVNKIHLEAVSGALSTKPEQASSGS